MMTTTCLIGVLVGALTSAIAVRSVTPARPPEPGAAVAAAAVSTLAASPATAITLIRLTRFTGREACTNGGNRKRTVTDTVEPYGLPGVTVVMAS